jgi:hypothetical protein
MISIPGSTSITMSGLTIDRFETRNRRLYAVMNLGNLVDVSGLTPDMVMTSGATQVTSPGTVVYSPGTIEYMDGRYSAMYNDTVSFVTPSSPGLVNIDEGGIADNDGNIIDFGNPGIGATISSEPGHVYELNGRTLPMFDRSMSVAVPVSVAGATCDAINLNLDISGLTGDQVRRDGTHNVMTDRTLELKGNLIPVTISSAHLGSTPLAPDYTDKSMCTVSDLINGQASRLAIVDHLNMLIGAPTSAQLAAMR